MIKWNRDLLEDFAGGVISLTLLSFEPLCRFVGTLMGFGNKNLDRVDSKQKE